MRKLCQNGWQGREQEAVAFLRFQAADDTEKRRGIRNIQTLAYGGPDPITAWFEVLEVPPVRNHADLARANAFTLD